MNPNELGLRANLEQAVVVLRNKDKPSNTRKTQEPKIKEFYHYCELVYGHEHYLYNLSPEKVHKFMFYQSFREQKTRGGNANKARLDQGVYFDMEQFLGIMDAYGSVSAGPLVAYPQPLKPISAKTFESYRAVLKQIHVEQEARRVCSFTWEQLWTSPCKQLHRHVKERAPMLKKLTYQEKVDGEFAPYAIVERYEEIEQVLWEDSANAAGKRSLCTQLRHLCCVKYLTAGILRSESLHRAELSDFLGLQVPKLDTDVHRPWLMIHQIPIGKTNHGQKLYGRATRHRDVRLCAAGGVAFYLQYCISISQSSVTSLLRIG
jgi:hypothetical protein